MKAVVLAGGFATRLWPITKDKAKPLLPLGKRPIIEYILEDISSDSRIEEVFVSTNKKFEKDFRDFISAKNYKNIFVTTENTTGEEEKLGAIGALNQVVEKEDIEGPLLVVAGDNYMSFSISEIIDFFLEENTSCIAAYRTSIEEASKFGVIDIEDEVVKDFEEKPPEPDSGLVSIACYMLSKDAVEYLNKYIGEERNPDSPGYFIEWLINREEVRAFTFSGEWFDIGTPSGYIDAYTTVVNETTNIGSDIINSEISTSYLNQSVVSNSTLKNCLIFEKSKIIECKLENVIVDGAKVSNQNLKSEVISNSDD